MSKKCSITGKAYQGEGFNAYPFPGRCCAEAYKEFVIPAKKYGVTPKAIKFCGILDICTAIMICEKMHK